MRVLIALSAFFLLCSLRLNSQEVSEVYVTSDTVEVFFRQDKIILDPQFRNNGNNLTDFARRFSNLLNDERNNVRSILIVSGASPEGPATRNRYLSDNRAKVVYDYLLQHNLASEENIEIESRGVDWKGLRHKVEESDLPYKEEVLEILDMPEWITEKGKVVDGRKRRLMNLNSGKAWRELYDLYFADLRHTRVMIAYNIRKDIPVLDTVATFPAVPAEKLTVRTDVTPPIPTQLIDCQCITSTRTDSLKKRPFYLAIKTNLLYDALVIPNIGAEIGLWRGLTVGGSYQNIWLRNKEWTRWYRNEAFEAEIKYYFNKENRPFSGHHLGLFGQMMTWDFTHKSKGYLTERWAYGIGISYGFALPIANRFNIDFEIGAGYLTGRMHKYLPVDGHRVWQSVDRFHWFGPTKIEISLQWLIGRGNHNYGRERK